MSFKPISPRNLTADHVGRPFRLTMPADGGPDHVLQGDLVKVIHQSHGTVIVLQIGQQEVSTVTNGQMQVAVDD